MSRILLDRNVPVPLRQVLRAHEVITTKARGWDGLMDGELLQAAEAVGCHALVTTDLSLQYRPNLANRRIGVVVLSTPVWRVLLSDLDRIRRAVDAAGPSTYEEVTFAPPGLKPRQECA